MPLELRTPNRAASLDSKRIKRDESEAGTTGASTGFVPRIAGRSREGRELEALVRRGRTRTTVLILGGFHGDEPKSVYVTRRLVELLGASSEPRHDATWVIVPVVNPDGFTRRRRRNADDVDLNRNFPTRNWEGGSPRSRMYGGPAPASEPETRAVMRLVERWRPHRIVTVHSISRHRHCNNYDGPARAMAKVMSTHNGYPVTASIGYPTPGSFGAWAGVERRIPVVTLELPSHHSPRRCWDENREAMLSLG